ncbi:MAG: hypothetical protein ACODAE_02045 [Gemmatimonadota bacterium]
MASARRILGLAALTYGLVAAAAVSGQTDAPMPDSPEARYFDFWPGTWVEVVDGAPDTAATTFTVTRGVHRSAFEERWKLVYDGAAHRSTALRAWDRVNERWMFTWVSDNGLFQVWEGRKVGDDWYIVREFEIDGERFLSRQAWIPRGRNELVRVMERSFDGGQSWETRSRTRFRRVSGPAAGAAARR